MSARLVKLVTRLAIAAILLSLIRVNVPTALSNGAGGQIDVFTQREPYGGKGQNMPSDAFGPDEIVLLFASVTYNDIPVGGQLVAFDVRMPSGASFSFSGRTNSSGISVVNFTIPKPSADLNESEVFGQWRALANVMINGMTFQDTLTFRVDWVVKLISVKTIDGNLTYRNSFGIGGDVGFEITLRSIAMVVRTAAISVVIKDELDVPVSFSDIDNFMVQPNEKSVFLYSKLRVQSAYVGNATVEVSAFHDPAEASGVPYCPPVFEKFAIMPFQPLTITFHDVAVVGAVPSSTSVEVGQLVNINAVVQDEGTEAENFTVNAYYNSTRIGTVPTALTAYSHATLDFAFNTSTLVPGNYTITVSIPSSANEADLTDNLYVDGILEVKPKAPPIIHDIAIVGIKISNTSLYIGESLHVDVNVTNEGTEAETFNVGAYYNLSLIALLPVQALAPQAKTTLVFLWDTSSVGVGSYQISAFAPLANDVNASNNALVDGVVKVMAAPPRTHLLDITSNPVSGVSVTINGTVALTPYSASHLEGIYAIVFPSQWTDTRAGLRYNFSRWEDGSTNPARTINLVSDKALTAYYERVEYTLTISATGEGTTNPPLGSYKYSKGTSVAVTALPSAGYMLDRWTLDGVNRTERQIIILMNMDHAITAYFRVIPTHTLSIASSPVNGVSFTINGIGRTTTYSATLEENNYTIIMPSSFTDAESGKTYSFDRWENGLTATNRTVPLDEDKSLTAYYKEAVAGAFVPDAFWWFLLGFLLLLLFILLIAWYYRRRRRKEDAQAFHSGWTAWYYCYNIPKKPY